MIKIKHTLNGTIVSCNNNKRYNVLFFDNNNTLLHKDIITPIKDAVLDVTYYIDLYIQIQEDNKIIKEYTLSLNEKKVLIYLDSSALGDTIAWMPFIEEFGIKHNCKIIVKCKEDYILFLQENYNNISFISDRLYDDYDIVYRLGFYENKTNRSFFNPRSKNLQENAALLLGLTYNEKHKIFKYTKEKILKEKYVILNPTSTLTAKYWHNKSGWNSVAKYLNDIGYKVVYVGLGKYKYSNGINMMGKKDFDTLQNLIYYSDFFIGLTSGLSWLSWSLNKKIIMISGFTKDGHEFVKNNYRVSSDIKCNGCFNNINYRYNKINKDWCPEYKKFECTKKITPIHVINKINEIINE